MSGIDDDDVDGKLQDDRKFIINGLLDESAVINFPKDDDFLPRYYQTELVHSTALSNKILFLPIERDKLYITFLLVNSFARENDKKIFYIVSSLESANEVVTYLRRHLYCNITFVKSDIFNEKFWAEKLNNFQVIIISFEFFMRIFKLDSISSVEKIFIFDDCAFINKYSAKEIIDTCLNSDTVVGLTSSLIPSGHVDIAHLFKYFKEMEITFKSSIITSQNCNIVKKYLTRVKPMFIKYIPGAKNFQRLDVFHIVKRSISDVHFTLEKLVWCDKNNDELRFKLKIMLNNITYSIENYGLYPTFVILTIYQIKLEKMKLFCNESLFLMYSAIITDFNVLRALINEEMTKNSSLDEPETIINNSEDKIVKLVSQLHKMDFEDNCVIFVRDRIEAQMIAHILQKLTLSEVMQNISVDYLVDDDDNDFTREKYFNKKCRKAILKKFYNGIINVVLLSWDSKIHLNFLSADWIIYFELPPSYLSYVISRKYANCTNNVNFFFVENTEKNSAKNMELLESFVDLDVTISEVLRKKKIDSMEYVTRFFRKTCESEDEIRRRFSSFLTKTNEEASLLTAIDLVNKYCEHLPCDGFTRPAPRWSIIKKEDGAICKLELPMQSGLRSSIECISVKNIDFVKNITALEAIKTLYNSGRLNDNLISTESNIDNELNDPELFPHWRKESEDLKSGSSDCCRVVPINFPVWFRECSPQANKECFLHIIHLKPAYKIPSAPRKLFFHKLMSSECEFGMLTSKQLPEICKFPIYIDLGQIDVHVKVNVLVLKLTENQIEKLIKFHRFVFFDVLQVVKGFLTCDISNAENSYCIIPLSSSDGILNIAWDVVHNLTIKEEILEPSEEQRIHTDYSGINYLGRVVTPWYRVHPQRYYIITNVLSECTPNSPFSSSEYETFSEYYTAKYSLEVKQPLQPLLEARAITTYLNCVRPRAQNPGTRRKRGEKEIDFAEILVPEFCVMQSFPAVYWYKAITLLAITHRLHFILNAETIRRQIASQSKINSFPDDEADVLIADDTCISEIEETVKPVIPISLILKDVKLAKRNRSYPWGDERLPVEIERNVNTTSIVEVMAYYDFMKTKASSFIHSHPESVENQDMEISNPRKLKFLELNRELSPGPKQRDILQALTTSQCGDIVNFERFKLIGNSFIKFACSFWLYKLYYGTLNVSQLNHLKQKLTGKQNLFYCGSKLELGSYLKLQDLSVNNDWSFGGFHVPKILLNVLSNSAIPAEVIFNIEIPYEEQITGIISSKTRNYINEKMLNYYNEISKEDQGFSVNENYPPTENNNHALVYLGKQSVPDKAVVDVLKALSGVYLANCGIRSGLIFLQYVGILKQNVLFEDIYSKNVNLNTKENGFAGLEVVCDKLNYKFKSKQLPLEAFTHNSCFPDSHINCNQKLAFLGDAVLDFLLTDFIYEYCNKFTINDVKDLRLSLVNDVFYAVLLVRLELHKFLFVESPFLMEKIDEFVCRQEYVKHEIDSNEYLFLIEETSSYETKSVDVPGALSDAFKAIIAAVFLDCNGDLKVVWNICYDIMRNEIEKFMNHIPKNPIRLLLDTDLRIEFGKPSRYEKNSLLTQILLRVFIDGNRKNYYGVGWSKHQAKVIAAKLALKDLHRDYTL